MSDASREKWAAKHPGERRCQVFRISGATDCAGVSTAWYTAVCAEGHRLQGSACSSCKSAVMLGCAGCWASDRKYSKVTVTWEELVHA